MLSVTSMVGSGGTTSVSSPRGKWVELSLPSPRGLSDNCVCGRVCGEGRMINVSVCGVGIVYFNYVALNKHL